MTLSMRSFKAEVLLPIFSNSARYEAKEKSYGDAEAQRPTYGRGGNRWPTDAASYLNDLHNVGIGDDQGGDAALLQMGPNRAAAISMRESKTGCNSRRRRKCPSDS
jgi:hypothetical protein